MTEENKPEGKKSEDNGSGWDEMLLPVLQDAVGGLVDFVTDIKPIDLALRSLSPSVVMASSGLPSAMGFISSKLASRMFKSPVWQDLFKDSIIEAGRHLRDKIQEKGGMKNVTPEEYGDAVKAGFKAAAEKKYIIIDGLLHSTSCARIQSRLQKSRPQGKDQEQQPQPSGNVEVTLLEAEQQHIMCAPCCFAGVEADIKMQTAAPAKVAPSKPQSRSPMEVLYSAKPEDRTEFLKLLGDRPVEERKRFDELLKHMDSLEEFNMLLQIMREQPEMARELLTLLENSGSLGLKQQAFRAAQVIEKESKETYEAIKKKAIEFDASFAPDAKRLRENDARETPDNTIAVAFGHKKLEKKGFWNATGRFVKSLFLFI